MTEKSSNKIEKIQKKSPYREYAEAFAIAIILALFIRTFIVQAFKIPSGSMKPTLLIGDHLLVNKFLYGLKIPFTDRFVLDFSQPKRGDIVVFKYPNDEKIDFIKRVIGVSGDKIEIKKDQLFINDKKIAIEYSEIFNDPDSDSILDKYTEFLGERTHDILEDITVPENEGTFLVPEGSLFVMGDNRKHSHDSRFWGFVALNKVKGKALIIYWSWPNWKRGLNIIR